MDKKKNVGFIMPIIIENIFTIISGLILSTFVSRISSTALAVVGLSNTAIAIMTAAFAMLTNGATVLTARLIGASDRSGASEIIEQTLILTVSIGIVAAALVAAAAPFLINIIMPSQDISLAQGASSFFRILIISFPPLILYTVLTSIMRSTGSSITSMVTAFVINGDQLIVAYILIVKLRTGLNGLGLSYIISRSIGAAVIFAIVITNKNHFNVKLRNLIKPKIDDFARIFRVGFPSSIESIVLQTGYLIANSTVISLGAASASIFQITQTFYTFIGIPQSICSIISTVYIGQYIGAGKYGKTKKTIRNLMVAGMFSAIIITLPISLLGTRLTSIYSSDPVIIAGSARMLWITYALFVPSVSINVIDPALRSGGDTRFTMLSTTIGVLIIRIPLTFLLCGTLGLGVAGTYWANIISLVFRTVFGWWRFLSGKWIIEKI